MALLQFSRICERFGMFFLLDLDLQKTSPLSTVQQHDDAEVLKLMEAKLKKNKGLPAWRSASPNDLEQLPIGSMPAWTLLVKTIRDQPWLIMRAWTWTSDLSYLESMVGKLFVQFTCQIWMQLDDAWLIDSEKRPEPMSLQDAIQSWSLDDVFKSICACSFKACNADIPGSAGAGRRQPSFAERMDIFFPEPTSNSKPARRSPWSVFWSKPGYIWEYHKWIEDHPAASAEFEFKERLGRIFSLLQTLPDAVKASSKTPGKTWRLQEDKVVLITNPKYYKIDGISQEKVQGTRRKTVRVLKPRNRLQMDLMEHTGYDDLLASKALVMERRNLRQARQRKSAKAKNSRKPPVRHVSAMIHQEQCNVEQEQAVGNDMENENENEEGSEDESEDFDELFDGDDDDDE